MTTTPTAGNYSIAQYLKSPIAIINEHGGIEWRNNAFENAFGSGALAFLQEAARAVAGERGWLQGFFLSGDDQWTIDVDIAGQDVSRRQDPQRRRVPHAGGRALVRGRHGAAPGRAGQVGLHRADRARPPRAALRHPGNARVRALAGGQQDRLDVHRSAERSAARVRAHDESHQRDSRLLEDPVGKVLGREGAGPRGRSAQARHPQPAVGGIARRDLPRQRARPRHPADHRQRREADAGDHQPDLELAEVHAEEGPHLRRRADRAQRRQRRSRSSSRSPTAAWASRPAR